MKTFFRSGLILLLLLASYEGKPQVNAWVDSVKNALRTQKADTNRVRTLLLLSDLYRFSELDSAAAYGHEALDLSEKLHFETGVFWSIVSIAGPLFAAGNYSMELDYALKAAPIAKRLNEPYSQGYALGMLSDCYYNLGEYKTSMFYWRQVIDLCLRTLPNELPPIYGNTSNLFFAMGQFDSALIYAKKSYAEAKKQRWTEDNYGNGIFVRSNIYLLLGNAFAGNRIYDSALHYYRMSLPYSSDSRMDFNTVNIYNGIAKVWQDRQQSDSAIWYGKKAFAEKFSIAYPAGRIKSASLLADLYQGNGQADSSLKYLRIAVDVKDSLFNREKLTAFQNTMFREEEKKKEIAAAKAQVQDRYRLYLGIALLAALLIVAGVIIRNRRLKQLQRMRNSIADDLHDDIGSTLSSISIMSELAKTGSPEAMSMLSSISESTAVIQENMSDIVWSVNPQNDRFENVLQRMHLFATEMLEGKNIQLDFISDASLATPRLSMQQRKNLYLFFKEVINNAAKYSGAGKVSVMITKKDHYLRLSIRDNGKGFDTSQSFAGNGMHSLKKRAAELRGDFQIDSVINEGTAVYLSFKIT